METCLEGLGLVDGYVVVTVLVSAICSRKIRKLLVLPPFRRYWTIRPPCWALPLLCWSACPIALMRELVLLWFGVRLLLSLYFLVLASFRGMMVRNSSPGSCTWNPGSCDT